MKRRSFLGALIGAALAPLAPVAQAKPFTFLRSFSGGPRGWTPAQLFAGGAQGAWYDESDLSVQFQDSAGTTAGAVASPVGKILDKSQGLAIGSEQVTTPYAGSATGSWLVGTSSVTRNGSAGGVATLNLSAASATATTYLVTFTVSGFSGDSLAMIFPVTGAVYGPISANGTYTYRVPGVDGVTTMQFIPWAGTAGDATITAISAKPIAGTHASQGTASARPVDTAYGSYYGLLHDGVDDSRTAVSGGGGTTGFFYCAAIRVVGGAAANRTLWSDTGTNTGYRVRINSSNKLELAAGNGAAYTTVQTTGTLSTGTDYVVTAWDDGTNLKVQINQTTAASAARPTVSAGTAGFTLGADNGAASGYANVAFYEEIYVKNSSPNASQIAQAQAFCAGKNGVVL